MHDDESFEQFLTEHKPDIPPAPIGELRRLQARVSSRRPWLRRPPAGFAAVMVGLAMALLVVLTLSPHPKEPIVKGAEVEAALSDSYGSLSDMGDDDGSGLAWFEPAASVD